MYSPHRHFCEPRLPFWETLTAYHPQTHGGTQVCLIVASLSYLNSIDVMTLILCIDLISLSTIASTIPTTSLSGSDNAQYSASELDGTPGCH